MSQPRAQVRRGIKMADYEKDLPSFRQKLNAALQHTTKASDATTAAFFTLRKHVLDVSDSLPRYVKKEVLKEIGEIGKKGTPTPAECSHGLVYLQKLLRDPVFRFIIPDDTSDGMVYISDDDQCAHYVRAGIVHDVGNQLKKFKTISRYMKK